MHNYVKLSCKMKEIIKLDVIKLQPTQAHNLDFDMQLALEFLGLGYLVLPWNCKTGASMDRISHTLIIS